MKTATIKYAVLEWISKFSMIILLLLPFHAFLTVWAASNFGHYITFRLWKEVLLALCALGVLFLLAFDQKIRSHTITRRLVWLILAYCLLNAAWGLLALNQHDVTLKAMGYGLVINLRFLLFFLVTWSVALRMARLRKNWLWLVMVPAAIVVVFGLLQILVLPHDFLRHFGYGDSTIPAVETVNHNANYVRIASTLRGANPLGAYLVIPISLMVVMTLRKTRNWFYGSFLAAAIVVLFFTYSRSALIGTGLSIIVLLILSKLSRKSQKIATGVIGALALAAIGTIIAFRHDTHFENFVFHTQTHSAVKTTSDNGHLAAVRNGLKDMSNHPLGRGPGTAGPASYYNTGHPERIAENYYIQVGQEVGFLGLALFLLINIGVGYLLWVRRADPLALSLFASLIGLSFINLLSHAWTDDTLAYIWWGLAGIAMVQLPEPVEEPVKKPKKSKK